MLLQLIVELFGQYGWEWTTQPANTPLANVDDAAIFPAFAKDVTSLGGMTNGGRYLQCEQLWETLQKVWDNYPAEKIARAFVHHSQVAAAIYDCKGGDEFVREHKGLSFGVRRVCRPYYRDNDEDTGEEDPLDLNSLAPRELANAKGVVVEEISEGVDIDSDAARDLTDVTRRLKYGVPDMREHDIGDHLSLASLRLIAGDPAAVDVGRLSEEQKQRWDAFAAAYRDECAAAGETEC